MNRFLLCIAVFAITLAPTFAADTQFRRLPVKEFRDKMQGAWLGQMIGVGWGTPTEFKVKGEIIPEDKFPPWTPEMVNQHGNDDCYVEMTFLRTLELHGFDASIRQAGVDFANSGYRLWHANKAGRDNLRAGIAPPDSGHPKFNAHADDIDYQIEADFSGIIAPGLPNLAIALGEKFGRLMNYGDGLYAGQFVGGMYAEAYFESDPWKLVAAGLKCVPPGSQYAEMIRDLLKWCRDNSDWTKTWELVEAKYHRDPNYTHPFCSKPGGKGEFSIDAKLNGAYIIMGLLYGAGDPDKTIAISCRCGQDSDCNPANAAGVLFAAMGAAKIPVRFTEKLDMERKFSFTTYALPQVYEVSEKLVRQAVTRAGGRIEKDASGEEVFLIPVQTPKPSACERSWEPGPAANVRFTPEEMAQIQVKVKESRSREGNREGSICDGDFSSFVVTFNGKPAKEDWYCIPLGKPMNVRRVVFAHGKNFHDGGWFDASAGKPKVQVQRERDGKWETVGELADYPATTASDNKNLQPGQKFTLRLLEPIKAVAVRVIGKPACGNKPKQAFSSCAELHVSEK
jgi:hypothetical protein